MRWRPGTARREGLDVVEVVEELDASGAGRARAELFIHPGFDFRVISGLMTNFHLPKSSLLILGDARSNYSDLSVTVLRDLAARARHAYWLNPEHPRHWDTGDSAAGAYGDVVAMVECRNLAQLGEFVHDLA